MKHVHFILCSANTLIFMSCSAVAVKSVETELFLCLIHISFFLHTNENTNISLVFWSFQSVCARTLGEALSFFLPTLSVDSWYK